MIAVEPLGISSLLDINAVRTVGITSHANPSAFDIQKAEVQTPISPTHTLGSALDIQDQLFSCLVHSSTVRQMQ